MSLNHDGNINFDTIIENILKQKNKGKEDSKYVILFDNISILPNTNESLIESLNNIVQFAFNNVRSELFDNNFRKLIWF